MTLPEKFRAAIEKGVRNIKGKLDKLNAPEKRQLLADLRKLDDCPDGWKNKKNMTPKKQTYILEILHKAIDRLLNPEKVKAANARNNKRRIENGKAQEYAKKIIEKQCQKQPHKQRQKIKGNSRSQCTGHFGKQRPQGAHLG